MALHILSTERLLPRRRGDGVTPCAVPLSVLDAGCARFSATGAIWTFDHCPLERDAAIRHLRDALRGTLADFPHLAGQLRWAPVEEDGGHTKRFGRGMVHYGSAQDPGIELSAATLDRTAAEVVPESRGDLVCVWDAFPQAAFMAPSSRLALADLKTCEGLPSTIVQLTFLKDGGFAVAVKMAHLLADASTLTLFMKHWAARSASAEMPTPPVFEPQLLDARAAGDIDGPRSDAELVARSRSLPLHRYDWWSTTAEGYPSFLVPATNASKPTQPALLASSSLEPVEIPPWETWDLFRPVSHAIISFTAEQVETLRRAAREGEPRASRLDALLAHLWSAINRARGLSQDDDNVHLNLTIGLRARTDPPLPESFLGAPLVIAHVTSTGARVSDPTSAGRCAADIRSCLGRFTAPAVAAHLHAAAHSVAPTRLWQAFLGRRHVLVTSWMRLGVGDMRFFAGGGKARHVHPLMPMMDGCVQVMDGRDGRGGVDVSVYLEAEAMGRLTSDALLVPK